MSLPICLYLGVKATIREFHSQNEWLCYFEVVSEPGVISFGVDLSRGLRDSTGSSIGRGNVFIVPKNAARAFSNTSSVIEFRCVIRNLQSSHPQIQVNV